MAIYAVQRSPSLLLSDILGDGRRPQVCHRAAPSGYYSVNVPGETIRVLPTLVATVSSYAFRDGREGMLLSTNPHGNTQLTPLTIIERELALGYEANATAAPGLTYTNRHNLTGRCFDINVVSSLLALCLSIRSLDLPYQRSLTPSPLALSSISALGGGTSKTLLSNLLFLPWP
jgi:hypothetical protein